MSSAADYFRVQRTAYDPGMGLDEICDALNQGLYIGALAPVGSTPPISAALIAFLASGTGAISRTAQAKLRDWVSVKDFGAVGDGVTNDATAIQAALDALRSATTPTCLFFPPGDYLHNTALTYSQSSNDINEKGVIGYGARLRGNLSASSPQLKITASATVRNFRWCGLGFYLGGSASSALHVDGGDGATGFFFHFIFRDFSVDTPSGDGIVLENTVFEGTFDSVSVYGVGTTTRGIKTIAGGGGISSITLLDCNTEGGLIGLDVPSTTFDVKVIGGTYNAAEQEGIKFGAAAGSLFQDVHVENNWESAANLAAGGAGITANGSAVFIGCYGTTNSKQKYVVGSSISSGKTVTVIGGALTGSVSKFGNFAFADASSGLILIGDGLTYDVTGSGCVTSLTDKGVLSTLTKEVIQVSSGASSLTPDPRTGDRYFVNLTQNITINNPTYTPTDGDHLSFTFYQNGVGGYSITWGTAYRVNFTPTTTFGDSNSIQFVYQSQLSEWIQVSSAVTVV